MGFIYALLCYIHQFHIICGESGGQQYELTALLSYIKYNFFVH